LVSNYIILTYIQLILFSLLCFIFNNLLRYSVPHDKSVTSLITSFEAFLNNKHIKSIDNHLNISHHVHQCSICNAENATNSIKLNSKSNKQSQEF